jgi:hypothetical protein
LIPNWAAILWHPFNPWRYVLSTVPCLKECTRVTVWVLWMHSYTS